MMSAIKQWRGMICLSLYLTLAIAAQANTLSIQTEFWEHQLRKELFHSSGSVQNLNSGFLIGVDKKYPFHSPRDSTSVSAEELKEDYDFLIGSLKKQNKTLQEEKERIKEMILQKNFGFHEKERVIPETHEDQTIPEPLSFAWDQFYKCTQETLPSIKELIQQEVQMEKLSAEDQVAVKASSFKTRQKVQQNRGDGSQGGTPQGVACGRFLGAAGFANESLKEDAKILAAISSRKQEEARLLTKVLVASHHLDFGRDNPEAFQQWKYFWNELSVKAVFSKEPLPPVSVFEELREGDLGEMFKQAISKYTQEGFTFAEEKLQ